MLNCIVNHFSSLFAANLLEGVAVEVVGHRSDEPREFVALTNETIILYVDVTFLVGVDLKSVLSILNQSSILL